MGRTYKDQRKYDKKQREELPKFKEPKKRRYYEVDEDFEELVTSYDDYYDIDE